MCTMDCKLKCRLPKMFIDRAELQSINQLEDINTNNRARMEEFIKKIKKWHDDDYKYGSSKADFRQLKKMVDHLNAMLEGSTIEIV